jgi:hypothetical protein
VELVEPRVELLDPGGERLALAPQRRALLDGRGELAADVLEGGAGLQRGDELGGQPVGALAGLGRLGLALPQACVQRRPVARGRPRGVELDDQRGALLRRLVELAAQLGRVLGALGRLGELRAQLLGLRRLGLQLPAQRLELAERGGDLLVGGRGRVLQRTLGCGGTAVGLGGTGLERRGVLLLLVGAPARLGRALLERVDALARLVGHRLQALGAADLLAQLVLQVGLGGLRALELGADVRPGGRPVGDLPSLPGLLARLGVGDAQLGELGAHGVRHLLGRTPRRLGLAQLDVGALGGLRALLGAPQAGGAVAQLLLERLDAVRRGGGAAGLGARLGQRRLELVRAPRARSRRSCAASAATRASSRSRANRSRSSASRTASARRASATRRPSSACVIRWRADRTASAASVRARAASSRTGAGILERPLGRGAGGISSCRRARASSSMRASSARRSSSAAVVSASCCSARVRPARSSASAAASGRTEGGAGRRLTSPCCGRGRSTIARPASSANAALRAPSRAAGAEKAARHTGASGEASGAASSGPGSAARRWVRRPSSTTSRGGDSRSRCLAVQRPEIRSSAVSGVAETYSNRSTSKSGIRAGSLGFERREGGAQDLFGGRGGVEHGEAPRLGRRELVVGGGDRLEERVGLALEPVGLLAARALARAAGARVQAQEERAVRREAAGGEGVDRPHRLDAQPAGGALVGQRRVDEAVEDHGAPGVEQRAQALGDELGAGGGVEQRLGARVDGQRRSLTSARTRSDSSTPPGSRSSSAPSSRASARASVVLPAPSMPSMVTNTS